MRENIKEFLLGAVVGTIGVTIFIVLINLVY